MDDSFIITAYSIIADTKQELGHTSHPLAKVSDPEIVAVAVVAAKYFRNHQERALSLMIRLGYIRALSVSRYNRRLHALVGHPPRLLPFKFHFSQDLTPKRKLAISLRRTRMVRPCA